MDIDNFKHINDTYGHAEGDVVLRVVADILQQEARESDFVSRYGGEEFTVALPSTGENGSLMSGERFRAAIENYPWKHSQVTASFGITTAEGGRHKKEDTPSLYSKLLAQADKALYQAKNTGKNQVCHFSTLTGS